MEIISHRGFWDNSNQMNTLDSFEKSFQLGFGIETDLRDLGGEIVISHDIPKNGAPTLKSFFEMYKDFQNEPKLALNIKADGLAKEIIKLIQIYNIKNYFLFDMSVPDGLTYIKLGMNTFTRNSEYEIMPAFIDEAKGIWLDQFNSKWFSKDDLLKFISLDKEICIVSPELHNREYINEWIEYKEYLDEIGNHDVMLCTDYPEEANSFFND